jgi:predicted Kef-type K+ transport protein
MDPLFILIAFVFGFAVYRLGLPPLVGYLIAGFALQAFGIQGGENLENIADMGVMLLLFTIGLKLKLKSLANPEIWAGAHAAYNVYAAAGLGFSKHVCQAADGHFPDIQQQ